MAVAAGGHGRIWLWARLTDRSPAGEDDSFGENTTPDSVTNGVVAVSAGEYFSLALKADGTVVGWGFNADGEATGVASLTATGLVVVAGQTLSNVVAISAGFNHSLALRADGSVVVWGDTSNGEGNIPPSASSGVVAISAGGFYSLALKADGSVVAWGWNGLDQTNIPASASSGVVGISAGRYPYAAYCLALKADGSAVAWGDNSYGQTNVPASAASGVAAVATASYYGLALKRTAQSSPWGGRTQASKKGSSLQRTSCPGLTVTGTVNVEVPGTYTLTYTVTNALGIVGTATRTVAVPPDTTPPVLPAQVVLTALPGSCQAALTPITATDISDPDAMVTSVPPAGTLLPLGITNIVCVATDASGNSSTGTVEVIVIRLGQQVVPTGWDWMPRLAVSGPLAVASSADGLRLVAVEYAGEIYTSTDGGLTWTPHESNRYWQAVASSADGTRLVAVDYLGDGSGGQIYTSTDAGATWTPREANRYWWSVASSTDGTRLIAVDNGDPNLGTGGGIYTSSDSGTNWTATSAPITNWLAVASSANGNVLIAAGPSVYLSLDSGQTWNQTRNLTDFQGDDAFEAAACTADGSQLFVIGTQGGGAGQMYSSTNAGLSWQETWGYGMSYVPPIFCDRIACSADGTTLVTGSLGYSSIWTWSGDATWRMGQENFLGGSLTGYWSSLASSADGNRLVAGTYDGQLYTSVPTVNPPAPLPTFIGATNQAVDLAGPNGTVVWFSVTATNSDECVPIEWVTCAPASGSTFPAGTNVVTCVAMDAYGCRERTNFTVEVRGNQAPTDILLSNSTVPALQPVGTTVGTLSAVGQPGDAYSFALVPGAGTRTMTRSPSRGTRCRRRWSWMTNPRAATASASGPRKRAA